MNSNFTYRSEFEKLVAVSNKMYTRPTSKRHVAEMMDYVRKTINCELLSVFRHNKGNVVLSYESSAKSIKYSSGIGSEFKVHSDHGGGLTGYLASLDRPVNLNKEEIETNKYKRKSTSPHLSSNKCMSIITVPVFYRKNEKQLMIKAENKFTIANGYTRRESFTECDELILKYLGTFVAGFELHCQMEASSLNAKSLIDGIQSCAYIIDENGHLVSANQSYKSSHDFEGVNILGKTARDLFPSQLADKYEADDFMAISGAPLMGDEIHLFKDGNASVRYVKIPLRIRGKKAILGIFWKKSSGDSDDSKADKEFKAVMDLAPEAIVIHKNSRIVYANHQAQMLLSGVGGYGSKNYSGRNIFDFIHHSYKGIIESRLAELYKTRKNSGLSRVQIIDETGCVKNILLTSSIVNFNGEDLVVACSHDASYLDREQSAVHRRGSELFKSLVDYAPIMVFVKNRNGQFKFCNKYMADVVFKTHPDNVIDRRDSDFFPDRALVGKWRDDDYDVLYSMPHKFIERERVVTKDNVEMYFQTIKVRVPYDGDPCNVLGISFNTSGQVQNELFLSEILNAVPVSIFWKDRNSIFLGCNKRFVERHAAVLATIDDVVGKTDFDFSDYVYASRFVADDKSVIKSRKPIVKQVERRMAGGGVKEILMTTKTPWLNSKGSKVLGVIGFSEELTLRDYEYTKYTSYYSHIVKHELGKLLYKFKNMRQSGSASIVALVRYLIEVSDKMESIGLGSTASEEVFSPGDAVNSAAIGVKARIHIEKEFLEGAKILGVKFYLVSALKEILNNSAVHSSASARNILPRIDIFARREAMKLHIHVVDYGAGYKSLSQNSILPSVTQSRRPGLGLYIIQNFVELAGGTIKKLRPKVNGVHFRLTFPIVSIGKTHKGE